MLVAALFVSVVAGSVFSGGDLHRLPKIAERSTANTDYTIFDPCATDKPRNRTQSCAQLKMKGENGSGDHEIIPHTPFIVRCDMKTNGGGWTAIQRRSKFDFENNGFEQKYADYENGFGGQGSSYWIGNLNLHALTTFPSNKQVLRIELKKITGEEIAVQYGIFKVGSQAERYRLTIGGYKGPDGYDALKHHNGAEFKIKESVNGKPARNRCYKLRSGGWWYKDGGCVYSNLNGQKSRKRGDESSRGLRIAWYNETDTNSYDDAYSSVEMKIRDADFDFCSGSLTYKVLSVKNFA